MITVAFPFIFVQERQLQTQRIGLKLELQYRSDEDIPRDPEKPARTTLLQLSGGSSASEVAIPWQDLTIDLDRKQQEQDQLEQLEQQQAMDIFPVSPTSGSSSNGSGLGGIMSGTVNRNGSGAVDYDSFEKQLREPDARLEGTEQIKISAEEDLLSGLPEYVTVRMKQQQCLSTCLRILT
jgi:hypothetical protein